MTGHDTASGAVSSDPAGRPAGSAAAGAGAWGGAQGPDPAPVNIPGAGLTMLGSVDGGDACADGACIVGTVNSEG